jgi:protein TonB
MFNQLIESKRKKQRNTGSTVFSIVFHGTLIAIAAVATAHAAIENEKPKQEKIQFVEVKKDEPPPPKKEAPPPPPKDVTVAPPPPKGFQVLQAPPIVPVKIPDIDLSKKVTNADDFSGKGVAGGIAKGVVGGTGPVPNDNQTYFEFQVEKPAAAAEGNPSPTYPEALRSSGVEGEVDAQFTVGIDGRADMSTFKVLKATNDLFAAAVRATLPRMKFYPAEVGGHKVKQVVQQAFMFNINH